MHYGRGDNYGRGDYYRGDYYRGDFFGLGHAFKSLVSGVGKLAGAAFAATPVGSVVTKFLHPSLPAPKSLALQGFAPGGPMVGPPSQFGLVNIGGAGEQGGLINIAGPAGPGPAGPLMKGYHLNKSTYETRGGGNSRWPHELEVHSKHTVFVRNRRMNVGNARALKRALRRAGAFARLARRVMSFTHPRAGRGHFKFKRRGKR